MHRAATPLLFLALAGLCLGCTRTSSTTQTSPTTTKAAIAGPAPSGPSEKVLAKALADLGLPRGDENLLVLSNAGSSSMGGKSTEAFSDSVTRITGCSLGKRSLLLIQSPATAPLWFSLFRRDTSKMVFGLWTGSAFELEPLDASAGVYGNKKAWAEATGGLAGRRYFQVMSISNAWAQGADWELLQCARFHNHCCGGVTGGYLTGKYIRASFPLRAGEKYAFVSASPSCALDALQVMFDATVGKKTMFATRAGKADLTPYVVDGVPPMAIVMRVNARADTTEGLLMGFAFDKTPQRTKLWDMKAVEKLDCVRVLKKFSGKASLAQELVQTKTNPYAVVWAK